MKKIVTLFIVLFIGGLFAVFFLKSSKAQEITENSQQREIKKQENFAKLIEKADRKGKARVIVGLKGDFQVEEQQRKGKIKQEQEKFVNRHQSKRLDKLKKFDFIPFLAFETDSAALRQMLADEQILTIEEDELAAPTLAESTALVGATNAFASGFSGAGQTIAILDTGVDKNHPFLNGKVVSEACYSSNYTDSTSVCPNASAESVAPDSGLNCAAGISGCGHGTHVAGIAAGRGANFSGVARDANIISIQVFSRIDNAETCGSSPAPCALSYTSDQLKALERVRVLSSSMNIAAVNMSLGGGQYADNCDTVQPSRKAIIDSLRARGIATVIASGNSGYTGALSAPACVSSAVSVGSTDDGGGSTTADSVSNFSNSSPLLTILAPGRWITSSVLNNGYSSYSGTSMAAPHVAGAFAVLKQRKPEAGVTQVLSALTSTGQSVADSRNGLVKPRIKIDSALSALDSPQARRTPFDFDGDGRADAAVFRPSNSVWYVQNTNNFSVQAQQFGLSTDLPAPADFDGDGRTDIAVFRPASGDWYWLNSSTGGFSAVKFGQAGDIPVPADFDGDGRADPAVFRPSTGSWYLNRSSAGFTAISFGILTDKPLLGDFDGDGKADVAVYRPLTGSWYRLNSSNGQFVAVNFGIAEDLPVPADFDGDGRTDIAVFRPSTGGWYRLNSATDQFEAATFGIASDKPAAADYDGDGRADIAVFRPADGVWYQQRSTGGFTAQAFGSAGDAAISNAFVR